MTDDPTNGSASLSLYARGGGTLWFSSIGPSGKSAPEPLSHAIITRTTANVFDATLPASEPAYVVEYPDGSQDIYYQSDFSVSNTLKVFLKEIADPQGNRIKLTYDDQFRIVEVVDALGQVTTLHYELPEDPLKVTQVVDPFGRTARFDYSGGRLVRITDIMGMSSSFVYGYGNFGRGAWVLRFAKGPSTTSTFWRGTLGGLQTKLRRQIESPSCLSQMLEPQAPNPSSIEPGGCAVFGERAILITGSHGRRRG